MIIGFWVVMMGFLLHRELGVRRLDIETGSRLQAPSETWMGIYLAEDQRVGHVHVRQSPEPRRGLPGLRMALDAELQLNLLGKETDLDLTGYVWRPYDHPEASFEFAIRSAEYDSRIRGELGNGELAAEVISAGETFPLNLPVNGEMIFSSGLGASFELPALDVGEDYRLETFDPLTLSKSTARIRCLARETLDLAGAPIETRHLQVVMNGFRSDVWIDDAGEVVRAKTPLGLMLQRLDKPPGTPFRRTVPAGLDDGLELLGHTAIRPSGERPFRSARTMTVALRGLEENEPAADDVQVALGGGRYRLSVPAEPAARESTPSEPPEGALAADTFVQSDHPKIRDQTAAIVGEEQDPWRRALLIHEWVFTRVDKEPVTSIPSTLEVLEKRCDDCNEHTVLFTALAQGYRPGSRSASCGATKQTVSCVARGVPRRSMGLDGPDPRPAVG